MAGETAAERWSPVQSVESVLISVLSLLDDAEVSSPANVDAGVMLRNNPTKYKEMVKRDLDVSKKDIPEGFVMPRHEDVFKQKKKEDDNMGFSWEDSDVEDDFGGSDSDMEELGTDEEAEESPSEMED